MIDIPIDLLSTSQLQEDVNIIIGDNGSGKSQLLNELANHYKYIGKNVVIIANSIHDKFSLRGKDVHMSRDRIGRGKVREAIKKSILNISNEGISKLRSASRALEYANFDPIIGIKVIGFKPQNIRNLNNRFLLDNEVREDIESLIYKINNQQFDDILWLKMVDYSFDEINQSIYSRILKYESILKSNRIITNMEFYLSRNGIKVPLYNASSGELSLISTLVFISSSIDENTIIIIDEPENSLHPKWQKQYVELLLNNFYYYKPKIIIATHSPILLNSSMITSTQTKIYKAKNFQFELHDNSVSLGIEDSFVDYFDIVTPENKSLSRRIVDLMNQLIERKINYTEYNSIIDHFNAISYDDKQKKFLTNAKELVIKILNKEFE